MGIPSAHCSLLVERSASAKYVQFAADPSLLPPLLFDLENDPDQLVDLAADPGRTEQAIDAARSLLTWRMRHDERDLSAQLVTRDRGLVSVDDDWR